MVMGKFTVGSSWWASGQDSALPLHGLGLIPGLGKLRSYKVHSAKKKKENSLCFLEMATGAWKKGNLLSLFIFLLLF